MLVILSGQAAILEIKEFVVHTIYVEWWDSRFNPFEVNIYVVSQVRPITRGGGI